MTNILSEQSELRSKAGESSDVRVYTGASGIGIVAGMRAMTAPAVMGQIARSSRSNGYGLFGHSGVATTLIILAIGEAITDKLPFTPNRTAPISLTARILSGAICGATLCSAQKRSPVVGALAGVFGAIGATFGAFELRRQLTKELAVPDPAIALIEDATAVWIGMAVAQSVQRANR